MKRLLLAISLLIFGLQISAQDVTYYMEDFDGGPNGWTVNTTLCEGTTGDLIGAYSLTSGTYDGQDIGGLSAELSIYTILEYTFSFEHGPHSGYSQGQFTLENNTFMSSLTGADFDLEGTIDSLEDTGRLLFSSQLNISQELFDQWGLSLTGAGGPTFNKTGNNLSITSSDGLTVLNFEKTADCGQAWIWHPDGQVGYGDILAPVGMGMISQSSQNGVMSLNADWLSTRGSFDNLPDGPLPGYESELISPSIDLSDASGPVYLRFNEALAYWVSGSANALTDDNGLDISSSVSYSIDGGQTWLDTIDVNADVKYTLFTADFADINFVGTNFNSFPIYTRLVELPNLAGNSDVRIRFNWTGTIFFWAVDDISLQSQPESNVALGDLVFPPASYEQPASQIGLDTMRFLANISNLGSKDAENVRLRARVLDPEGNLVHEDSLFIDVLPAGYTDSLFVLPETFNVSNVANLEDDYTILYTTASDSADVNLSDNYKFLDFKASADRYAKEDGDALFGSNWPSDFRVGCYYTLDPMAGSGWQAVSATYSAFTSAQLPSDPSVTTLLYQVREGVREDFLDFDFESSGDEDDLEVLAFGTSTFPAADGEVNLQEVSIGDIDGNPAPLQAGGRYFIVNNYEGAVATQILHLYDRDIAYFQTSAVVFVDGRWFLGFGSDSQDAILNAPVMRMTIQLDPTSADEQPLPETALNIYPNPTVEQLSVDLDLEENGPGLVIITNAEGKVMLWQKYENIQKETLNFNVNTYPAGNYFIRLGTEEGTKTLPFVIAK